MPGRYQPHGECAGLLKREDTHRVGENGAMIRVAAIGEAQFERSGRQCGSNPTEVSVMRASKLLGLAAIGLFMAGFVALLPDIKRYIRINTM